MTTDELIAQIESSIAQYKLEAPPPPPPPPPPDPWDSAPVMADSAALTAALAANTPLIKLDPAVVYEATQFVLPTGTHIRGQGATVRATGGPALYVKPGTTDVTVEDVIGASSYSGVVKLGDSSSTTQGSLELVPRRITLKNVSVPYHRGQRAFEIHAADVVLLNCSNADTYSPALVDSQGIWIHNTPGPVLVDGGSYSAGSEIVMVGGDSQKIPGLIPADLTFQNLTLSRPLSWQTDGVSRGIKNIFELKSGERVLVKNVIMDGTWTDAQISYAIVITPREGGGVRDVTFDSITVRNVGGGLNIMGTNNSTTQPPTPFVTTGIKVINSTFDINKTTFGGLGYLALFQRAPGTFEFTTSRAVTDNYYGRLTYVESGTAERIWLKDSAWLTPYYTSVAMPVTLATGTAVTDVQITGNRIANASAKLKTDYPNNTYVTAAEF
jgi:hypothetical protein